MMLRTELLTPPADIWTPETYNALFTTHGLTMLFFFVTPVFTGLGTTLAVAHRGRRHGDPQVNAIECYSGHGRRNGGAERLMMQEPIQFGTSVIHRRTLSGVAMREVSVGWTLFATVSATAQSSDGPAAARAAPGCLGHDGRD